MKRAIVFTLILLVLSLIRLQTTPAQVTLEHGSSVSSVMFLSDGKTLAAVGSTIKLWDIETQENIATFKISEIADWSRTSIAFSPDGTLIAVAGDNKIKLWDVKTHADITTLEGHQWGATSIAFSPDGMLLASAGDNEIKLWDVKTHANIATLEDDWFVDVTSVMFSPDGTILASINDDNKIKLWDVKTHENIATLEGHRREVHSVAFSPDGTTLASGGKGSPDGEVKLWDLVTYQNTATLTVDWDDIYSVAFSPDGTLLASGGKLFFGDGAVKLWDVKTHENIAAFEKVGSFEHVTSVSFSPDGTLLASGSTAGKVKLWNIAEWTSTLEIISGNNQEGIINTVLANPLVVEVRDREDNPLPDVQVTFTVTEGVSDDENWEWDALPEVTGGVLNGESTVVEVTTDANGKATQTLTVGPEPGTNSVEVSIGNESVRFEAEGVSRYQLVKISGDGQYGTFGTALANPLVVEVRDRGNNQPLEGVQVTFTVTEGEGLLNGESTTVEVTTDANGRAAQTFTLGYAITNTIEVSAGYARVWFDATGASPGNIATLATAGVSVSLSPDGTLLASGAEDNTVKLWDMATHTNIATLATAGVSVSFSPDGMLLASGAEDNTVKLWDMATHTNIATLEGHTDIVLSVSFSPDGTLLASGAWDGIVKVWNTVTKQNIATLGGHNTSILEGWLRGWYAPVAFSPDGKTLVYGTAEEIRFWDVPTKQEIATIVAHPEWVVSLSFSSDGTLLASNSTDVVKLWNVETRENIPTSIPVVDDGIVQVAFIPNSAVLAYIISDVIVLWDVKQNRPIANLEGHTAELVWSLSFSPDGTTLASSSEDIVKLWDIAEAKLPRPSKLVKISGDAQQGWFGVPLPKPLVVEVRDQYDNPFPEAPVIFRVTAGDGRLSGRTTIKNATTDADGKASITFTPGQTQINTINVFLVGRGFTGNSTVQFNVDIFSYSIATFEGHRDSVNSVSFSPDGTLLASGSWDNTVKLWEVKNHTNIATLAGHTDIVLSVSFSPDGALLASGSWDNTVKLWDVATHTNIAMLEGHTDIVLSVSFSPDGTLLASGSRDNTVKLWDVATHTNIATLAGHRYNAVTSVSFSPDSMLLASGSWDRTVKLWDVQTHTNIATLEGHRRDVESVSFSPDGTLLASGSEDNTVKLWDVQTHTNIATLEGHTDVVWSVSFSPDGTILASGGDDVTVKLWDVATHTNIATLAGHRGSVTSVSFSPDGTLLASGSRNNTVKLWDMSSFITSATPPETLKEDVNGDGVVNIQDLVLVASSYGHTGENAADVNEDGVVHIYDIILVAGQLNTNPAAPPLHAQDLSMLTPVDVKKWLSEAQQLELTDATSLRGIFFLEQLLAALIPKETALLPNYPNPFNPETWIPYRLAEDAFVTLTIYDNTGRVVRTLEIGHRVAAFYENRSKAIHWDGRNEFGEQVASGVYFYHLSTGDYSATRKMLILK